ncbi:ABC transporter substrate-binding protein [Peterkaempfera bronchialis]|uniref:Probable sugar-binding periplasmic protein n=1 Tax=Peterkaempfera bronchialis TaxID=2126346 RepID=A0A345T687_9ACTN|nr:ABC transporter substrate-binding protein [Peterkaempfera bronchialis]AXI81492.1 carbohydrate ABC transporter substrate-binding protein [Peterkaempfera bronchialis]
MSRRAFLLATGAVAGSAVLSACGSKGGDSAAPSGEVEVFSWWTEGAENAGLQALLADLQLNQPNITFVNRAVAGGAGGNAKAELAKRLDANNPPDSFQGHAGAELSDYIRAGKLEDLNALYDEQKWTDVFPEQLLPLISSDGKFYSVPVNIHRANMLWSNPKVLRAAGADPAPKTFEAFLGNLQKVKRAGGTVPLVVADSWTLKHLLETVMLATLGDQAWTALWSKGADWSAPEVRQALENFHQVLTYTNASSPAASWDEATTMVGSGKAAYQVMGDWAEGSFKVTQNLQTHTDYTWAPVPGTAGMFQFLSDSFTLPKGAKHRDAALAWLRECGSKTGQLGFNGAKGSIPTLTNLNSEDRALFGQYLKWSMDEWKRCRIVGSLAHGVVANNAWSTAIDGALDTFVKSRQVPPFQGALVAAARQHAV